MKWQEDHWFIILQTMQYKDNIVYITHQKVY